MPSMTLYDVVFTATERVLLLLGWDKIKDKRHDFTKENEDAAYSQLKKANKNLRRRLKESGIESEENDRPNKADWEKDTPQLRHVTCATTTTTPTYTQQTWTSGNAFDAAATGTV